mmetsp:Transcript_51193/g.123169  ORF Transcript_51193/g.123169 Transcript_51193/m.123169 type:complete len:269 (-) Transcript_51193:1581-2387(-)
MTAMSSSLRLKWPRPMPPPMAARNSSRSTVWSLFVSNLRNSSRMACSPLRLWKTKLKRESRSSRCSRSGSDSSTSCDLFRYSCSSASSRCLPWMVARTATPPTSSFSRNESQNSEYEMRPSPDVSKCRISVTSACLGTTMPHLRSAWLSSSSVMWPEKSLSMLRNMRRAVTECSRIFSFRLFSTNSICDSGHTSAVPSMSLSEYSSALSMTSCWPLSVTVPPTYRSPAMMKRSVSGSLYLPAASHLPPTMPELRTGGSNTDSVSSARL